MLGDNNIYANIMTKFMKNKKNKFYNDLLYISGF